MGSYSNLLRLRVFHLRVISITAVRSIRLGRLYHLNACTRRSRVCSLSGWHRIELASVHEEIEEIRGRLQLQMLDLGDEFLER